MLDRIVERTRLRVKRIDPFIQVEERKPLDLEKCIMEQNGRNSVIAEIKFRSPSKGMIREYRDPMEIASGYIGSGCCGISVLTEREFFGGNTAFIERIRPEIPVPILRKDFIVDEIQVRETAALGADAVLLIEEILESRLGDFIECTDSYDLDALVEVHDEAGMEAAISAGARIIGINNRNLKTMETDLDVTKELAPLASERGLTVVCESGISGPADIRMMKEYCNGFLVGTYLMSAEDPGKTLEELICA